MLCSKPVLIHPRFDREFVLYTDGSRQAIPAILSQADTDIPNLLHPIYDGSRALVGSEKNMAV